MAKQNRIRVCFLRVLITQNSPKDHPASFGEAKFAGIAADLSAGIRVVLVAVGLGRGGAVAGSLVLVLYLSGGIQLHVRNYIGAQLSGADAPCALVLIVVSALNFLDALAILSYLIQEGIFLSSDVQVAGAVSGRLSDPGDEVDVGLREQVSDLLVELGVVSQVQSALTSSVEGEPEHPRCCRSRW